MSLLLAWLLTLPLVGFWLWRLRGRWRSVSVVRRLLAAGLVVAGWGAMAMASGILLFGPSEMRKLQTRSRQIRDAQHTLGALYHAQLFFVMETDGHYEPDLEKVGFAPTPGALFSVRAGDRLIGDTDPAERCPITGSWPDGGVIERSEMRPDAFVATAVLPLESETLCWSLASFDRTDANGVRIPAGHPRFEAYAEP